jgi:hypothetical protein
LKGASVRICDRCGKKQIKTTLQNKKEFNEHDFCSDCYDEFLLFLSDNAKPLKTPETEPQEATNALQKKEKRVQGQKKLDKQQKRRM